MQASNILEWRFYHNSIEAWIAAGTAFVVVGATLFLIRTLLARRLAKVAERTATTADDAIVDLLRRTRYFFIIATAIAGGMLFLDLPDRARNIGQVLGTIALILQIAIWGNGLITFWFRNYAERKAESDLSSRTTIAAFSFVARAIMWVMLSLVALRLSKATAVMTCPFGTFLSVPPSMRTSAICLMLAVVTNSKAATKEARYLTMSRAEAFPRVDVRICITDETLSTARTSTCNGKFNAVRIRCLRYRRA